MMTMIAGGAAATLAGQSDALAAGVTLDWKAFPAGENGFFRAPVLVWGPKEAVLIDGGFTLPDGQALADAIKATGRELTTVYVSQSDPDYYFSLGPIKAAFPDAKVLAAADTIADIVMPTAFDGDQLTVDGQAIQIVPAQGLANRRYLWAPSLSAVFGGVLVFSGVHVWTADTAGAEARAAWVAQLDALLARKPAVVVPGHMTTTAPTGSAALTYTRDYLLAFEQELAKAKDSAALIAAMTARYPDAGMGVALQIGAKVATGEMKWG
jgi:glyoxylase-like metal-dependent hydrolase (beta-lactamase superfamily II)